MDVSNTYFVPISVQEEKQRRRDGGVNPPLPEVEVRSLNLDIKRKSHSDLGSASCESERKKTKIILPR